MSQTTLICYISFKKHYTTPWRLAPRSDCFSLRIPVSMGYQRTLMWGFKEFGNGLLVFAGGHFPRNFIFGLKLAKIEGSRQILNLYWDSYYNEIQEMKCIFWWFFESAGLQKRSDTLPELTSIKKHICNIKYKIIYFSACFSCGFEIDFHRKFDVFYC